MSDKIFNALTLVLISSAMAFIGVVGFFFVHDGIKSKTKCGFYLSCPLEVKKEIYE